MLIFVMFSIEKWSVYKMFSSYFRAPMFYLPIVIKLGVGIKIEWFPWIPQKKFFLYM